MIRLAAVFTVFFIACSSFPDEVPSEDKKDENATSPPTSAQLPPSSTKSNQSPLATDASTTTPTETSPGTSDASTPDASPTSDAGMKDASPTTKVGFGQSCTNHAQCADGLCLPFENKGLRCTKVCQDDDDCPSHDCKDQPQVCDVD